VPGELRGLPAGRRREVRASQERRVPNRNVLQLPLAARDDFVDTDAYVGQVVNLRRVVNPPSDACPVPAQRWTAAPPVNAILVAAVLLSGTNAFACQHLGPQHDGPLEKSNFQ
jgi:hypothetical protein